MEKSLQLDIVTPDRVVLSQKVDYVSAPGAEGEFGVLPGHIPFLAALGIGCLNCKFDKKTQCVFVSGGFAEISDDKVTILVESSELAQDIDMARAEASKRRAEERISSHSADVNIVRAQASLQRAIMRLHAASRR